MPTFRRSPLSANFLGALSRLKAQWRSFGTLRVIGQTGELNAAIREGNACAVKGLLQEGASLYSCTLDHEGYHTPYELALRYGNRAVIGLLENAGRSAKS